MGSLFTEGNHLYLDRESAHWQNALRLLLDELFREQEKEQVSNILLRDFDAGDTEMHEFMVDQGFVKIDMPESCVVEGLSGQSDEAYVATLSQKNRRHYVQKIKRNHPFYTVEIKSKLSQSELAYAIKLFRNVKNNNFAINSFHFPEKLFQQINESEAWEFVVLHIKPEHTINTNPVAVCFCHTNAVHVYSPMLIGMDYEYLMEYGVYRQTLFEVVKRANALGCSKVNFGISATIEKKRIGAVLYPKVGYFQAKDNFAMEMMEATIAVEKE